MDWQLEAVFCEHCFSWEFVGVTWAPTVASGLLRDAEQTVCTALFPPVEWGWCLPVTVASIQEPGRWAGAMSTSSCCAELGDLITFFLP